MINDMKSSKIKGMESTKALNEKQSRITTANWKIDNLNPFSPFEDDDKMNMLDLDLQDQIKKLKNL